MLRIVHSKSLRIDKRAFSPAISSVIMIAAVMVMVLVAVSYANYILDVRLAESEFSSNKQFMLTTGLQIDDVAWTLGRTQTITYSSRFGHAKVQSLALNYSVDFDFGSGWEPVYSNVTTSMIMYNMPITKYNLGNNYFERVSPRNNGSFLQQGATAPVSHVFVVEQLLSTEGDFARIVAVPTIRYLNSSIVGPSQSTTTIYYKFFLPTLQASNESQFRSQSVTMTGSEITKVIKRDVDRVRLTVSFPNDASGYDSEFFKFDHGEIIEELPPNSVVEFYVGKVIASIGLT